MRHIRSEHKIEINGSADKRKLISMGYFHGYKAYRFYQRIETKFDFEVFSQIVAISNFDNMMKTAFYPVVMKFESLIKNYLIEQSVKGSDPSYDYIYTTKLTDYRSLSPKSKSSSKQYTAAVNNRLRLKKSLDSAVAANYQKNEALIKHYIEQNAPIPLWAIFEVITLGTLGDFAKAFNSGDRIEILKNLNLYDAQYDPKGTFLYKLIYAIRPLRNSIAHNNVIFDCRFNKPEHIHHKNQIPQLLRKTTAKTIGLAGNTEFNTLFDYMALLIIILKESGETKRNLKHYVKTFSDAVDTLFEETKIVREIADDGKVKKSPLPVNIYDKIVGSGINNRIRALQTYISE